MITNEEGGPSVPSKPYVFWDYFFSIYIYIYIYHTALSVLVPRPTLFISVTLLIEINRVGLGTRTGPQQLSNS